MVIQYIQLRGLATADIIDVFEMTRQTRRMRAKYSYTCV